MDPAAVFAQPIMCQVRPQMLVRLGDGKLDFHSGCAIMEVNFPNLQYVEIGEIHFKNFYTSSVSLQAKLKGPTGETKWKCCVRCMQLMPDAHTDRGSEDYFTITPKQMAFPLQNITRIRFVLRQPSPVWREFKLESVTIYKGSIHSVPDNPLPAWLSQQEEEEAEGQQKEKKEIQGLASMESLSSRMQQMWAMVEQMKEHQPQTSLGRYDVDGSYEINLLSYT